MQVDLNCTKVDEACWNVDAINAYAERATNEELRQSCAFDVQVFPGRIACTGCIVGQDGQDTLCSARLTPTRVEVWGHPEETNDLISAIPGFEEVKPALDKPE